MLALLIKQLRHVTYFSVPQFPIIAKIKTAIIPTLQNCSRTKRANGGKVLRAVPGTTDLFKKTKNF